LLNTLAMFWHLIPLPLEEMVDQDNIVAIPYEHCENNWSQTLNWLHRQSTD